MNDSISLKKASISEQDIWKSRLKTKVARVDRFFKLFLACIRPMVRGLS